MIWVGLVLWHINHYWLFNAKSFLYIYIKYIWFGLVGFYGISTIVGYLMPNTLYTYIINIWFLNTFCRYPLLNNQIVLFQIIQFSIHKSKVKWFQVLLCIPNNSIKHQSFVCTQLNEQTVLFQTIKFDMSIKLNGSPWCNGYRRRKWTRQHEFKSWTRLIAFHIALIPLGKVWIQLFSLQLWERLGSSALVRQVV